MRIRLPLMPAITASVATLAVAAGCGSSTIDSADLQTELADQLAPQAGVRPADVSVACPDDEAAERGHRFDCTLTAPNGDEVIVNVTIRNDEGGFDAVVPPQQFD